jgi:hypothetical protein
MEVVGPVIVRLHCPLSIVIFLRTLWEDYAAIKARKAEVVSTALPATMDPLRRRRR